MKKIIVSLLALVLAFACTACGNDPIDYYADGIDNLRSEEFCQINFTSTQSFAGAAVNANGSYSGTIKLIHNGDETEAMELSGTSTIDPGLGSNIDVAVEGYYCDGTLYQKMTGSSYALPATWNEAKQYLGLISGPVEDVTETDFKAIAISEENEGTSVNFIFEPESEAALCAVKNQWERYAQLSTDGSYSISDIRGSLLLDASRLPVSANFTVTGEVQYEGEAIAVTNDISLNFSYPDELTVETPAAGEYEQAE